MNASMASFALISFVAAANDGDLMVRTADPGIVVESLSVLVAMPERLACCNTH